MKHKSYEKDTMSNTIFLWVKAALSNYISFSPSLSISLPNHPHRLVITQLLDPLKPYPAGPLLGALCVCVKDTEENRVTSPLTAITVIIVGIVNCFFFLSWRLMNYGGELACVMSSRRWRWRRAGQVDGRIKAVKEKHWRRD